jgi:hypothetical protein
MMSEFEVVSRRDLPPQNWTPKGFYGRVFVALTEVKGDAALKVPVADSKRGLHMRNRLQEIANKERIAKTVEYRRSKDGKEFFFWLDDRAVDATQESQK